MKSKVHTDAFQMGKSQPQLPFHNNQLQQQQNPNGSLLFLQCYTRIAQLCSFKCVFILLLSLSVSLFSVFSIFHFHHAKLEFDANDSIKNSGKFGFMFINFILILVFVTFVIWAHGVFWVVYSAFWIGVLLMGWFWTLIVKILIMVYLILIIEQMG